MAVAESCNNPPMISVPDKWQPLLHRLKYFLARYSADRCNDTAAALTYMSLFALVPLLTVLYTMASAVPAFQGLEGNIQNLLFDYLMPEASQEIQDYLDDFSRQAKNLTGFGIAFLGGTAILMLRNIEKSFNRIWRTPENRSPVSSFLLYWAVLSLAPLTIGLGLAVSTYLLSFADVLESLDIIGVGGLLLKLSPLFLNALGFTLIYAAVPNCRVPLKHALIGGMVAAVAFSVARGLFTMLVSGSSFTFIYGAFAAVPLFLLWIFISWNIVLLAAILVHGLSAYESSEQAARPLVIKALEALHLLWRRQQAGLPLRERELMADRSCGIDSDSWSRLRRLFLQHNLISQNDRGHYLLARDLHTISLWQVVHWVGGEKPVADCPGNATDPWETKAIALLSEQEQARRDALDINLVELFTA
ncbi:MAG: YihY family inner membrane protein [Chromatocurvus sp.]